MEHIKMNWTNSKWIGKHFHSYFPRIFIFFLYRLHYSKFIHWICDVANCVIAGYRIIKHHQPFSTWWSDIPPIPVHGYPPHSTSSFRTPEQHSKFRTRNNRKEKKNEKFFGGKLGSTVLVLCVLTTESGTKYKCMLKETNERTCNAGKLKSKSLCDSDDEKKGKFCGWKKRKIK